MRGGAGREPLISLSIVSGSVGSERQTRSGGCLSGGYPPSVGSEVGGGAEERGLSLEACDLGVALQGGKDCVGSTRGRACSLGRRPSARRHLVYTLSGNGLAFAREPRIT